MKLIVGLGNPGRRYRATRHNVGAEVVALLAHRHRVAMREEGWTDVAPVVLDQHRVLLARPQTYVNVSGTAVADLRRRHRIALPDLLVIYDDLDLPLGLIRLRPKGGHGGHNGMRSIVEAVGGSDFPRVRIGVGRPPQGVDPAEFVLSRFPPEERVLIDQALVRAADAAELFIRRGIEAGMNAFNTSGEASSPDLHTKTVS